MGQVRLAKLTMQAIDAKMTEDQGASFRQLEKTTLANLEDAYRGVEDPFRSHMGASGMGEECGRAIWYGFRWATKPKFDGRRLRLFNRGHIEEGRIIASLMMIGCDFFQLDENGKQFRISGSSGHYGGSGDGFVRGLPDLPPELVVGAEFKTHNDKNYQDVKAKGVRESKFPHYVQMQQYMRKFVVPMCLYVAVNKNDDELYMELVTLDSALADQFIERADKIIWMHDVPDKMPNASAGWFKCKWCDHRPVCHLNVAPDLNCRTCAYSEPRAGGDAVWWCRKYDAQIPKAVQLKGCGAYEVKKM